MPGQFLAPRWGVAEAAIACVVVAALVALVWVALTKFGIAVPDWVVSVFWIVLVAVVVVMAIRFVSGL